MKGWGVRRLYGSRYVRYLFMTFFFLRIFHLPTLSLSSSPLRKSSFLPKLRARCVCVFFLNFLNFLIYLNTKSKIMGITGR